MKHFTSVKDIDKLSEAVKLGFELKTNPFKYNDLGKNKTLGLLFFNSSLRTRLSTQKAAQNLGMNVIVITSIPDENVAKDSGIISKILIPQVNYNDKMIQTAQIEVSVGI